MHLKRTITDPDNPWRKVATRRVIAEATELMCEALHEGAHAVAARVLPSPFLFAKEFRARTLKDIFIEPDENYCGYVAPNKCHSPSDLSAAYRSGNTKRQRAAIRLAFKSCIISMAGPIAEGIFLRPELNRDERFDAFWALVEFYLTNMDYGNPDPSDAETVTLYLQTALFCEYNDINEVRLNEICRGLFHIAHRVVERNWWCIKAVAGNAIYSDGITAPAVNFLIDRLAIGHRRKLEVQKHSLVRRIPEIMAADHGEAVQSDDHASPAGCFHPDEGEGGSTRFDGAP